VRLVHKVGKIADGGGDAGAVAIGFYQHAIDIEQYNIHGLSLVVTGIQDYTEI
jgi:hypothetical protein